jgi:uncharacterized protein (TIGR02001 family)
MRSDATVRLDWASDYALAIASAGVLLFNLATGGAARAQTSDGNTAGSINLGGRGAIAPEAPTSTTPAQDSAASPFGFSARAGFATDYMYRGTTLSDHKPAVGTAFEATAFDFFYATSTFASVRLPSQPAAEFTMGGGVRPKLGNVTFDFSVTRFVYPWESPPPGTFAGIDYWETSARADTKIGELLRVAGGFAYSPNVSNSGAWSKYAAFGLDIDVPQRLLPPELSVSMTGIVGYSWFGNQSVALGGFPLPAYLNWNAGVTFSHKNLNLDLRYYDTNLSKENCFVLTGDPGATPGGSIDPVRNPEGLMSRWCSATFVAKFWFALNK